MVNQVEVRNLTRGITVADSAVVADTSKARRTGLLKHDSLPKGQGLLIVPCEAVHTFGMKFPIDVLFLSGKRKVLKVRREMGKRRIAVCLRAHSVLELPAGVAEATGTQPGDQLEFQKVSADQPAAERERK